MEVEVVSAGGAAKEERRGGDRRSEEHEAHFAPRPQAAGWGLRVREEPERARFFHGSLSQIQSIAR